MRRTLCKRGDTKLKHRRKDEEEEDIKTLYAYALGARAAYSVPSAATPSKTPEVDSSEEATQRLLHLTRLTYTLAFSLLAKHPYHLHLQPSPLHLQSGLYTYDLTIS